MSSCLLTAQNNNSINMVFYGYMLYACPIGQSYKSVIETNTYHNPVTLKSINVLNFSISHEEPKLTIRWEY